MLWRQVAGELSVDFRQLPSCSQCRATVSPLDRYGFPPGYTLHAVCFSILLPQVELALAIICIQFAAMVAVSRVVLGLHYPTDVIV